MQRIAPIRTSSTVVTKTTEKSAGTKTVEIDGVTPGTSWSAEITEYTPNQITFPINGGGSGQSASGTGYDVQYRPKGSVENLSETANADTITVKSYTPSSAGFVKGSVEELECSKMIVTSGYRTAEHDKAVGGNGVGQHTLGRAADVVCYGKDGKIIPAEKVCCTLEDMGGIYGIGYISKNAVHVDTRSKSKKWWGDETKPGNPNISKLGFSSFHEYFKI